MRYWFHLLRAIWRTPVHARHVMLESFFMLDAGKRKGWQVPDDGLTVTVWIPPLNSRYGPGAATMPGYHVKPMLTEYEVVRDRMYRDDTVTSDSAETHFITVECKP